MVTGTTPMVYETEATPRGSIEEERRSPVQLISTIGVLTFRENTVVNDRYVLRTDLTAEVRVENDKYVAVDYQLDEYGIGDSLQEARQDLLDSLADYLASLEKRESRLADRELRNLQLLRNMLARR